VVFKLSYLFKVRRSHEAFFTKPKSTVLKDFTEEAKMSTKKRTTILFVLWRDSKMNLKMKRKKVLSNYVFFYLIRATHGKVSYLTGTS